MGLFGMSSTRRKGGAKSSASSSSSSPSPADRNSTMPNYPSSRPSKAVLVRSADPFSSSSGSTTSGPSSRRAPATPTIRTSWDVNEFGREDAQTWKRTLDGARQKRVAPASPSSSSSARGAGAAGSGSRPIGARSPPIQSRFNEKEASRARMSIVSSPRSSVYASPLFPGTEARGRFEGEGGTDFIARPPRRESLMIDTMNCERHFAKGCAPSRLSVTAASGLVIPDSPSSFFDPNLPASPASPASLASPPPQAPWMAYNSPLGKYHGPSSSPSRNSSNSLLGGMGHSSPILSPSLFAAASRNGQGSPDTTASSIKAGASSISSHDQSTYGRPLSAMSPCSMARPVADSHVTRLQDLSLNSPEAAARRPNGSRESSPLGGGRGQHHGPIKLVNGQRQQSSYASEVSPSRQAAPSKPSTPMILPPLQTRRSTKVVAEFLPDPFAGPVRSVSQNNPRARALAAARERDASSSDHSDAGPAPNPSPLPSPLPSPSPRLTIRTPGGSALEKAIATSPAQLLRGILAVTKYDDFCALRSTSRALRRCMDEPVVKEIVLQRYLGPWGYRSYALGNNKTPTSPTSSATAEPIILTLRDLDAFLIATEIQIEQYARFAKDYNLDRLHATTLRVIRASTRAWNRVVLRLRWQFDGYGGKGCWASYAFEGQVVAQNHAVVFRSGRAPTLRTWVPLSGATSWMADNEVVECEREIWRSGVWGEMRRGDVVVNTAIAPFGNLGKLIFDGKFLRDFEYRFDVVGHLPNWLGMLSFSPQYYHNIVAASTSSPVFYLWLQTFASQAHESLVLREDKVHVTSPQGGYMVKRFMYRGAIQIRANDAILDISAPTPQVVHPDWAGTIMIEIEGTTEHRRVAMEKIASPHPTPWRILRDKSRPGKLWIRPVSDQEAEHTETSDAEEGGSQSAAKGSVLELALTTPEHTPELTRTRLASPHQFDMDGLPDDWMNRVSDRERKQDAGLYNEIIEFDRTPSVPLRMGRLCESWRWRRRGRVVLPSNRFKSYRTTPTIDAGSARPGPVPDLALAGNGASDDESLNTQTREMVTGGTANPAPWSPEATQARANLDKSHQEACRVLKIIPSSKSTLRLMVLTHNDSTPPSPAPALARAVQ
ncbi:BQ2448_5498 [Microbotryum intermedium]|uniref:BQ2448_5498 protein n=1 Tax=Microbotryum intermedium TaxID=269621 RepID=A0A238F4A5_9BASI|nr:BQ2448_5498 [Microbotryum intermedium]